MIFLFFQKKGNRAQIRTRSASRFRVLARELRNRSAHQTAAGLRGGILSSQVRTDLVGQRTRTTARRCQNRNAERNNCRGQHDSVNGYSAVLIPVSAVTDLRHFCIASFHRVSWLHLALQCAVSRRKIPITDMQRPGAPHNFGDRWVEFGDFSEFCQNL